MSKSISVKTLKTFDAADYLETEADMAAYLDAVMQDGDAGLLAAALGDVAKARGMSEIAKASGLTREALYKALRADAQPRLETVQRVFTALGLKLTVQPANISPLAKAIAQDKAGLAKPRKLIAA